MTPRGYLTIPEVLKIIRARIDDDDMTMQRNPKPDRIAAACESLAIAIRDGSVAVYTMSGGAVIGIGNRFDDIEKSVTRDLIGGWETWLSPDASRMEANTTAVGSSLTHTLWNAG